MLSSVQLCPAGQPPTQAAFAQQSADVSLNMRTARSYINVSNLYVLLDLICLAQ